MCCIVFVVVEYPLHTGCKVVRCNVCFFICIDVNPFYAFTNVECPVQTIIFCAPLICNTWNQFTMCINLQQWILHVGQIFQIKKVLAIQNIECLHFSGSQSWNYQIFDFILIFFCLAFCSSTVFICLIICCFAAAATAATTQHQRCCQCQSQQFGYCFLHNCSSFGLGVFLSHLKTIP